MINEYKSDENFNLYEFLHHYIRYYKFFIISVFLCLIICFLYLRHISPVYKINSTLLVKEEKTDFSSKLEKFSDMGLDLSGNNVKIENEIQLLKSRTIISSVVKSLNLNIEYYNLNSIKNEELFDDLPFNLSLINHSKNNYNFNSSYEIKKINNSKLSITNLYTKKSFIYNLGNSFEDNNIKFIITPNNNTFFDKDFHILVKVLKTDQAVDNILNALDITLLQKESSVLALSIKSKNISKGKSILNELVKQHSRETVNDKIEVSVNTLNFIKDRIGFITSELSEIEKNVSKFKSKNKIINFETDAQLFVEKESENQKLLSENQIQIELNDFILNHLKSNKSNDLLPFNIGISNNSIDELIGNINNLIIERNKLLVRSKAENPIILNLENQISILKNNLKESLIGNRKSLRITNLLLNRKQAILDGKLNSAPKQEKDFREIHRQQQIKESLYLFLLQKREETSLQLAISTSNTKIIDRAYCNMVPVSPNKILIYALSIIIGILIPFSIIYIFKIFNTTIQNANDIRKLDVPILGDLPYVKNLSSSFVIESGDRSSLAEAFRILRTNINFFLSHVKNNNKTIFVTSTLSSEGKSFVSINLSKVLAMTGKKVLLVGFDIRLPKILEYLNESKNLGVTNYIIDKSLKIDDIIFNSDNLENVDIIPSGIVPPNPSELMMNERVEEFFTHAKEKYDYIIVDTAPSGLVTDTLLIKDYADLTVYITRVNILEKKSLNILSDIYNAKKLKNICVLLNGVDYDSGYGYGKGYGYGAKVEVKPLKKFINFFKFLK